MQDQLQDFGYTLYSNSRSKVSINKVFDHLNIPYYPKTSFKSVAHFVHFLDPLLINDTLMSKVYKIVKEQISKVY